MYVLFREYDTAGGVCVFVPCAVWKDVYARLFFCFFSILRSCIIWLVFVIVIYCNVKNYSIYFIPNLWKFVYRWAEKQKKVTIYEVVLPNFVYIIGYGNYYKLNGYLSLDLNFIKSLHETKVS